MHAYMYVPTYVCMYERMFLRQNLITFNLIVLLCQKVPGKRHLKFTTYVVKSGPDGSVRILQKNLSP
jgi:hypothetical protein